jgi:hypothetical protein
MNAKESRRAGEGLKFMPLNQVKKRDQPEADRQLVPSDIGRFGIRALYKGLNFESSAPAEVIHARHLIWVATL